LKRNSNKVVQEDSMPSNQMSAGSGKAAKFVAANPLAPMADPFAGMVRITAVHYPPKFSAIHLFVSFGFSKQRSCDCPKIEELFTTSGRVIF